MIVQFVLLLGSLLGTTRATQGAEQHPLLKRYEIVHKNDVHHSMIRRSGTFIDDRKVKLLLRGEEVHLQLERNNEIFFSSPEVYVIGEDGQLTLVTNAYDPSEFYRGTVVNSPQSKVLLHIHKNGMMTGTIEYNGLTYAVEAATSVLGSASSSEIIVYELSDLVWPKHPASVHSQLANNYTFCDAHDANNYTADHTDQHRSARATTGPPPLGNNTCMVGVRADYRFYLANDKDLSAVVNKMLSTMAFVDNIYRATNFGIGQNVGMAVKEIVVNTNAATDDLYKESLTGWSATSLLTAFGSSKFKSWSSLCLAHLFTDIEFAGGVQGLANLKYVCDGFGVSTAMARRNIGWTTSTSYGASIPVLMADLVTTHEVGHNFGASHDNPDNATCAPANADGGKYAMFWISVDGMLSNNKVFSNCSKEYIKANLIARGWCFTPQVTSFCGNGKVEPPETCDSGTINSGDRFCNENCTLKPGFVCSDTNHICCRDGMAAVANATVSAKTCFTAFDTDSQCRATTYCTSGGYECPAIGQKPLDSICVGANGVEGRCANNNNTCLPYCSKFGAKSCTCTGTPCVLCCMNDPDASPFCPFRYTFSNSNSQCEKSNSGSVNGSRPFNDTCQDTYSVFKKDPSKYAGYTSSTGVNVSSAPIFLANLTSCPTGVCQAGTCVATKDFSADLITFFSSLTFDIIKAWFTSNMVAVVIIFVTIFFVPIAIFQHRKDVHKAYEKLERLEGVGRPVKGAKVKGKNNKVHPANTDV